MQIGEYRFYCTLEQDARLPAYKGSTFRGAFGVALKQTVCALKRQDCPTCLLRSSCLYARVFEIQPSGQQYQRLAAAPHPYLIKPPLSQQRHYPSGSAFDFELVLFGSFNESLPFFVYALKQMGETGVGKGQATFTLNKVTTSEQTIFKNEDQKLSVPEGCPKLILALPQSGTHRVTLNFITPLRLKHEGKLVRQLDFQILMRAVLRRISGLLSHYGAGEPALDYRRLVAEAATIKVAADNLHWHDWQRYSNRQQESMQFGGLLGEIAFEQVPGDYLPLLEFAGQVSLGKQTSFGLGQFALDIQ